MTELLFPVYLLHYFDVFTEIIAIRAFFFFNYINGTKIKYSETIFTARNKVHSKHRKNY